MFIGSASKRRFRVNTAYDLKRIFLDDIRLKPCTIVIFQNNFYKLFSFGLKVESRKILDKMLFTWYKLQDLVVCTLCYYVNSNASL